jgi:diacylglycerol O-acyltransferase / wax synthase
LAPVQRRHIQRPRTNRAAILERARLDEMYPLSIPTHGQALNINCTSTDDQIAFGLTGCHDSVPDLHQLTDYLDDELTALEHAASAGT